MLRYLSHFKKPEFSSYFSLVEANLCVVIDLFKFFLLRQTVREGKGKTAERGVFASNASIGQSPPNFCEFHIIEYFLTNVNIC